MHHCWRVPRPPAGWALDSEEKTDQSQVHRGSFCVAMHGDETESCGTCEALSDMPLIGDNF